MKKEHIKSEAEKSWDEFVKSNNVNYFTKQSLNSLKKTYLLGFIKGANWVTKISQSRHKV